MQYFCESCQYRSGRWMGFCPQCQIDQPLSEETKSSVTVRKRKTTRPEVVSLKTGGDPPPRLSTNIGELDRVLGGGLVSGAVILLGGEPGVGKSSLLLQVAGQLAGEGREVLLATAEESAEQVSLRARRLGVDSDHVRLVADDDVDGILAVADDMKPSLMIIDSIQTVSVDGAGAPGGVSQVRESAARIQAFAKQSGTATVLVGHVTKGGALAGPRTLEHVVDVVLEFEGRRAAEYRFLRSTKNRFGSVDELAAFRMTESGLDPVEDPSGLFLSDRPDDIGGSAVAVSIHGSQPILTEIQALTSDARFGAPQRMTTGYPSRRLAILLAVLERRGGVSIGNSDVFLNVVGGARLTDPGTDLAVIGALASAQFDRPIGGSTALIAEVGLGGELRGVTRAEARVRAAKRAGLEHIVLPATHREALGTVPGVRFMSEVRELIDWLRPQ